jgi:hypothetical protein
MREWLQAGLHLVARGLYSTGFLRSNVEGDRGQYSAEVRQLSPVRIIVGMVVLELGQLLCTGQ